MITVKILLFSTIRARIGKKQLELNLPAGSSVNDLKQVLENLYPDAAPTVRNMLTSVNQVFSGDETILPDWAEVAFFPQVSGG
ncbi:MAG TPA: MoaD/ThiS family protein [Chloroflexi bacterium]|nr:MoaD/ThiS family protein [Chloroflexota bacterium]